MLDQITDHSALIVVDIQNDFASGGALAVPAAQEILAPVNTLIGLFAARALPVIATQDWHPADHGSFASQHPGAAPYQTVAMDYGPQVLWPDHCVQATAGAAFVAGLNTTALTAVIRKGWRQRIDSYSGFLENDRVTATGLSGLLAALCVQRIFVVGLATDFCVRFTAVDARRLGLETFVVMDCCRGIDLDGSMAATLAEFAERGVVQCQLADGAQS